MKVLEGRVRVAGLPGFAKPEVVPSASRRAGGQPPPGRFPRRPFGPGRPPPDQPGAGASEAVVLAARLRRMDHAQEAPRAATLAAGPWTIHCNGRGMEATSGIEPEYTDLQSAA